MRILSKKRFVLLLLVVFMLQLFPAGAFAALDDDPGQGHAAFDSANPPKESTSVADSVYGKELGSATGIMALAPQTISAEDADILLIQSRNPWDTSSNEEVLNQLGFTYHKVSISDAITVDFEPYKLIIVANDQDDQFYRKLSSIRTKLELYVMNGGTLLYGISDAGWGYGTSDLLIPGDVRLRPVDYSYYNYIQDSAHPIVTGALTDGTALTNGDLYNNYTSHRSFETDSLPFDTRVILNAGSDRPTLVEYPIGDGIVVASGLTWEFSWAYRSGNDGYGTFGKKAFDDLIVYAYSIAGNSGSSGTTSGLGIDDIENGSSLAVGDPVNVANGNFFMKKEDLSIDGPFPLAFIRFYNTIDDGQGGLGAKWHHNFEVKLKEISNRRVRVTFEDGHTEDFIHGDDGIWYAMPGKYSKIDRLADGTFVITSKDGLTYNFDPSGHLQFLEDTKGNRVELTYDSGRLIKLASANAFISLEYEDGLVVRATDSTGRSVEYGYTLGCLTSVKDVEGQTSTYACDDKNRITTIIDSAGIVRVANIYDEQDRVTHQTLADGSTASFVYDDTNLTTTYTERNGAIMVYVRDKNNRITERRYEDGTETLVFNDKNQITAFTDKNGHTYAYEYDEYGNVIKETNPLGIAKEYGYNANRKLTMLRNPDGSTYEYTYDDKGNMLTAKDPLGRVLAMNYNTQGLPSKVMLPTGKSTSLSYDVRGNVTSVSDPDGNMTRYTYDELNRLSGVIKPNGSHTEYKYTASGKTTQVTHPDGTSLTARYDSRGLKVEESDESGRINKYKYDDAGQLSAKIDATGGVTSYEYDSMGNVRTIILPDGSKTVYTYNKANLLASVTDGEGYTHQSEYDGNGNLLNEIDPNGNQTEYIYDGLNRLIGIHLPNGAETQYEYRYDGKLTKLIDALNNSISYSYDTAGQLLAVTDQAGATTSYTYDATGNVESITNPYGAKTRYEYNGNSKITKVILPDATSELIAYDANGNLVKYTGPNGHITTYSYDQRDRLTTITNAAGKQKKFEYSPTGKLTVVVDENGNRINYTYDGLDRLSEVVSPEGGKTAYGYDAVGNLIEIHQYAAVTQKTLADMKNGTAAGFRAEMKELITKYKYDKRGLLLEETNPAQKMTIYRYDANGNRISMTDRDGLVTKYGYDAVNHLSQVQYQDGKIVEYSYNPLGQAISMTDWNGTTNYELDAVGRVKKVTDYQGRAIGYAWGLQGEQQAIDYPDGSRVKYEYDVMGRLLNVTDAKNKVTSYAYDAAGNISSKLLPNGFKTVYEYDALSRLTYLKDYDKTGNIVNSYGYVYDAVGNRLTMERKRSNDRIGKLIDETEGITQYKYDKLNQLIQVQKPSRMVEKYFYDTLGNRIRKENWLTGALFQSATNYKYDNQNRLTRIDGKDEIVTGALVNKPVSLDYDERGNLVKAVSGGKILSQYEYDTTNRMVSSVNKYGIESKYEYDGAGRRIKMSVEIPKALIPTVSNLVSKDNELQELTNNLFDGVHFKKEYNYVTDETSPYNRVLMTYGEHNETQRYTYGFDVLSVDNWKKPLNQWPTDIADALSSKSKRTYFLLDEMGSPAKLVNESGKTEATFGYDAFGRPLLASLFSELKLQGNIHGYTGYQYDLATGLFFAQARYYMPETGRFVAEDTRKGYVQEPLSLNRYAYAYNQPMAYKDQDGYEPVTIGNIYIAEGTIDGESRVYVGSTAQDLKKRIGKHHWKEFLIAESTTVRTVEVKAEMNVASSGRGTLFSARNEALRAAEQKILNSIDNDKLLNEIRAATPENAEAWAKTHTVETGSPKISLKGGIKVGAIGGFALLDAINIYREINMSEYVYAPYILQDEGGLFKLSEEQAHWFAHHYRWKVYVTGALAGQKIEVTKEEFNFWRWEGESLWGTVDLWGNFVPGLLRPELEVACMF
ncbi:hypothetical protein K0T92_14190 [Paenibacillus oenotherae]|uniref:Uncharacterized protein n=1 Tax=Paenibacillus oenotherae TaxID=1435645 RepID=A0ABS7D7H2_9BACL|nr:DUF6531 domain-containing protein [Paenibacillus oenotherae]MBW7475892.1 hypothetical protein [Paenibacillus oenotherae]